MKKFIMSLIVFTGLTSGAFAAVNKEKIREILATKKEMLEISLLNIKAKAQLAITSSGHSVVTPTHFTSDSLTPDEAKKKAERYYSLKRKLEFTEINLNEEDKAAYKEIKKNIDKVVYQDKNKNITGIMQSEVRQLKEEYKKLGNIFERCTATPGRRASIVGIAALLATATTYGITYYNTAEKETDLKPGQMGTSRHARAFATLTSKLKNPLVIVALTAATTGAGYWIYKG